MKASPRRRLVSAPPYRRSSATLESGNFRREGATLNFAGSRGRQPRRFPVAQRMVFVPQPPTHKANLELDEILRNSMDRCEKFRDPDQEPERPESIAHHAANSLGGAGSPRSRRMPHALRWMSWRARCRRSA